MVLSGTAKNEQWLISMLDSTFVVVWYGSDCQTAIYLGL